MKELNELLGAISGFLWGWPMIILLLGTHLFLTVRLRFPQRHIFKAIRLSVQKDEGADGDVSQFGALVTAGHNRDRKYWKMQGGPMYALERGLGMKWLGVLFAIFTAVASFGIGSTVQAFQPSNPRLPEADLWEPE